jgi:hypothetical protein
MAFGGRPGFTKRQKELARKERQKDKAERRAQRRTEHDHDATASDGEDPDLAGIVAGPQPPALGDDD